MKILILTNEVSYIPSTLQEIFIEENHIADIVLDSDEALSIDYIKNYDLLVSSHQKNNLTLCKAAIDHGIPTFIGASWSKASPAKVCEMFSGNEGESSNKNTCYPLVADGFTPLNAFLPYTGNYFITWHRGGLAPGGKLICQYSASDTDTTCAIFPQGAVTTTGGTFGANCAFFGATCAKAYSEEGRQLIINLINWIAGRLEPIQGRVIAEEIGVPRQVIVYRRDTGLPAFFTESDENGLFSGYIPLNIPHYIVAFDEEGGNKNAVILDKIVQV